MPKKKEPEVPKSKAIRELEHLIARLSSAATPDPKGGCFCLARDHTLSLHTPSCPSCALILCTLNPPYHLCPSCSSPLLTQTQTTTLLTTLQTKLSLTRSTEEKERQRLIQEAKRAEGAFPTLASTTKVTQTSTAAAPVRRPAHEASHKVLSITSSKKNKAGQKIVIVSRTTPASSRPSSLPGSGTSTPLNPVDLEEAIRVPAPPSTVEHPNRRVDQTRPWRNCLIGDVKYVPEKRKDKGKGGTQVRE